MTEKMGGAEGTKLDVDFMDMERVSMCFYAFKVSTKCSCFIHLTLNRFSDRFMKFRCCLNYSKLTGEEAGEKRNKNKYCIIWMELTNVQGDKTLIVENGCHVRAGGGVTNENERVPSAKSHSKSEDGRGQGHQQAQRSSESLDLPPARRCSRRLYAYLWKETRGG